MSTAIQATCFAAALAVLSATPSSQANHAPLNNGAEFYFTYSDPSVGSPTGSTPDVNGDLWWRAHPGDGFMNDVHETLGSVMSVAGYLETLIDEDWSTSPSFLDRTHGPAVATPAGLQPAFLTLGFSTEVLVSIGPSGFGSPCTMYPSLCVPPGSTCAAPGTAWGWAVSISLGATPGSGVVLPADGTAASDMATTWFLQGGWSTVGGACGGGTYETSDLHSVDETQADVTGLGTNPSGGFQFAGGGPVQEGVASMSASVKTFHGNLVNILADGGHGTNGRNLSVGSGLATLGVELQDQAAAGSASIGIVGASTVSLGNPGIPALGGWLGVLPNGLFTATSAQWQGTFMPPGIMIGVSLPVPAAAAGVTLYTQGATFSLVTFTADTTNVVRTSLLP